MQDRSTNEKIADLLAEQTYAERREMAETFRDYLNDWLSDKGSAATFTSDEVAFFFECYVETFDSSTDQAKAA